MAWQSERREIGRAGAKSAIRRMIDLMMPVSITEMMDHAEAARRVSAWEALHPEPKPPWRKR